MINFLIWIIVGGILGWIASLIMRDAEQGPFLNIIIGVVGALVAGWVLSPLLGISTINEGNFSLSALAVSLLGAIILLGVVNLLRRGTAR